MPQLAFAHSFWESYDVLEKPVKAGVRKAMAKFQQLTVAELHSDKGIHLESVDVAAGRPVRGPPVSCGGFLAGGGLPGCRSRSPAHRRGT